jgi:hypothetical protein
MYYLSGFSMGSGWMAMIIFTVLMFIKGLNKYSFWIYKIGRWIHMFIAYFTILWSMWTIFSGLFSINFALRLLFILHFIGYLVAFFVLEII